MKNKLFTIKYTPNSLYKIGYFLALAFILGGSGGTGADYDSMSQIGDDIYLEDDSSLEFSAHSDVQKIYDSANILILGDSLTEGYGVTKEETYPYQLEQKLKSTGFRDLNIIVDAISGSTSSSGMFRLKRHIDKDIDYIIIALGGNDGLRGTSVKLLYRNLEKMIELSLENDMKVIFTGIQAITNYGEDYAKRFKQVYFDLALKYKDNTNFYFYEFLLKDVAAKKDLNIADGIHPNGAGYKVITKDLSAFLIPILNSDLRL